jgi:hypothetical protein
MRRKQFLDLQSNGEPTYVLQRNATYEAKKHFSIYCKIKRILASKILQILLNIENKQYFYICFKFQLV